MERLGLPFYRASESPLGVRFAMPAAPSMGPSSYWLVVVPGSHAAAARAVVRRLPVSRLAYPGVWAFGPTSAAKHFFKACAWIYISAVLAIALASLLSISAVLFRP
jgi:hypothetical protein